MDKSLLVAEERQAELRYRLLETILLYRRRRLSEKPEEAFEAQRRPTAYFVALAEKAQSQLRGANQQSWMDRLQLEHDNLRGALRRSLEGSDPEATLRLSSALWYFRQIRGHVREGHDWLERALQQPNLQVSPVLAKALTSAGAMSSFGGKQHLAQARFREALAIFEQFGDQAGIAATLNNLAVVSTELGEYLEAEQNLERCLILRGDTKNAHVAVEFGNLGWVAEAQGDFVKAIGWHRQALAIWRAIDDHEGLAASLIWQSELHLRVGDQKTARTLVDEGLRLARELDSKPRITRGLRTLGAIAANNGELGRAAALLSESLLVALEGGFEREAAVCLTRLADVALQSKQHMKATQMLAACDRLQRSGGWVRHLQERKDYERCLAQAQTSLTDEEFLTSWGVGQGMSLELFLGEGTPAQSAVLEAHARCRDYGALTSREIEVVRLVARGRTNREIAHDLVIAVSTAERHVANILRKLDLTSRTQIAARFVERTAHAVLP